MIWPVERLRDEGQKLNEHLRDDFLAYSGRKAQLDYAVAYACLVIANNSRDPRKRDDLIDVLQGGAVASDAAYKALRIRRWSPVKKAIEVYTPLVQADNMPALDELLSQQRTKDRTTSPSWSTLMPDKIYALARFWQKESQQRTSRLQTPFGRAVQAAYSAYSGVLINSQPTPTHHTYLHGFERTWSTWGKCDVIDINSGLHRYAQDYLL